MTQLAIPVDIRPSEIARERSLGDAISLCVKAGGKEPKELQIEFKWDKGQWSRWESGDEGIKWQKLVQIMDFCGNDAPLLWMLHARGYELTSVKKRETEWERRARIAEERALKAEEKVRLLSEVMSGRTSHRELELA
jgi:hypothetical protein